MAAARTIHADLWRVFLLTLASLFLIPAVTLVFTHYALQSEDKDFIQRVNSQINAAKDLTPAQKADEIAFYDTHRL